LISFPFYFLMICGIVVFFYFFIFLSFYSYISLWCLLNLIFMWRKLLNSDRFVKWISTIVMPLYLCLTWKRRRKLWILIGLWSGYDKILDNYVLILFFLLLRILMTKVAMICVLYYIFFLLYLWCLLSIFCIRT